MDTILPRHLLYIVLVFIEKPLHIVSKLVNVLYIKNEGRITFAILYPISIKVEATEGHLYCCCPVLGRVVAGVSVWGHQTSSVIDDISQPGWAPPPVIFIIILSPGHQVPARKFIFNDNFYLYLSCPITYKTIKIFQMMRPRLQGSKVCFII